MRKKEIEFESAEALQGTILPGPQGFGLPTIKHLGQKSRILIVDNHPVFRQGLDHLINSQQDVVTCGETDDPNTAVSLVTTEKPDLVIIDLGLKRSNGLELIKTLRAQCPAIPILVLTMHEEGIYTERCLRAGARGYITKDRPGDEILVAIRRVLGGRIYLSDQMGTKLLSPLLSGSLAVNSSPIDRLSDRELEVFQLLGNAYETRQIAEKLRVSVKTVESYREHIKMKLNLENSTQLIHQAAVWVQAAGAV